jgi:hypothetical protein
MKEYILSVLRKATSLRVLAPALVSNRRLSLVMSAILRCDYRLPHRCRHDPARSLVAVTDLGSEVLAWRDRRLTTVLPSFPSSLPPRRIPCIISSLSFTTAAHSHNA